jgi:cytochrome c553
MAVIAIASSAGASLAGDVETVSRNCTWCHGTLGRGYTTAPRLAGQRHEYIITGARAADHRHRQGGLGT